MKALVLWMAGVCVLVVGVAAMAPVRHRCFVERSDGNPVQHVVLESRSLLGFKRNAWRVRCEGSDGWGNSGNDFFLAPKAPMEITVTAWPGFRRSLSIQPVEGRPDSQLLGQGDREAFRSWFVAILEQQLDAISPAWEPPQRDCAGLLRFAFREAWGPHTESWRDRVGFTASPVAGDPSPRLAGPWRRAFPSPDGWRPFVKGSFLRTYSCVLLGRDPSDAKPGDLIFFARGGAHSQPDHAMAFVRPDADGQPVLLYHTGPEGSGAARQDGEIRRVRLEELQHHPDPEFRPMPENPAFLGVYRWKVLCGDLDMASLSDPSIQGLP